ncbi:hypothetical protein [Lysobacter gummosus]
MAGKHSRPRGKSGRGRGGGLTAGPATHAVPLTCRWLDARLEMLA